MIAHRLANASDLVKYYGDLPPQTVRAIVIDLDGEPAAILGMTIEPGRHLAFSDFKPALEPHLKSMPVLRAIKTMQKVLRAATLPIYTRQDFDNCLLERLGFRRLHGEVFKWAN